MLKRKIFQTSLEIVFRNGYSDVSYQTGYIAVNFVALGHDEVASGGDKFSAESEQLQVVFFGEIFNFPADDLALDWEASAGVN